MLGEDESNLLGAYLITAIKREMSNRQYIDEKERSKYPFMLYIDEFTKYLAEKSNEEAFAELLIRARKNFVALHLAHQDTADLSDNLNTKLGGAGARVFLNLTPPDAQRAARYIVLDSNGEDVTVSANKLQKMTPGECYVSLFHEDTQTKEWHHAKTFEFKGKGDSDVATQIIDQSESYINVDSESKIDRNDPHMDSEAPDLRPDIHAKAPPPPERSSDTFNPSKAPEIEPEFEFEDEL